MIPAIGGAVLGIASNAIQREQQKKLTKEQIKGAKELSDYEKKNQMDIWNKTNYGPQVDHMKAAGLNPALIYGMGGGGGATTGGGGGGMPTGGVAEGASGGIKAAMDIALMGAQKKVLESQAKKNEVEADKTAGVDTAKTEKEIEGMTQGITNAKQLEAMQRIEVRLKAMQEIEASQTLENRIDRIQWEAEKAYQDFVQATTEAHIGVNTRDEKIRIIQQEAISGVLKNLLTEKQIQATDAQITKISADIAQGWEGLAQGDERNAINKFSETVKANYPSLMNVIGRGVDDGVETIFKLGRKRRPTHKGMQEE